MARWLPTGILDQQTAVRRPAVELTPAERSWIAAHPVIRVAGDRAWPPIESVGESGRFEGLAADYLQRIEELVGLRFEHDLESGWAEAVTKLRNRQLDMFSAAAATPQRLEYARFTPPDRKSVVEGKGVYGRVGFGGCRTIKKKKP